jgi:hypothetical protein
MAAAALVALVVADIMDADAGHTQALLDEFSFLAWPTERGMRQ